MVRAARAVLTLAITCVFCLLPARAPAATVSTLAGSGDPGSVDGAAATAQFSVPAALAVDRRSNVFVADAALQRIRKITPAGIVETVAGSGPVTEGFAVGGFQDGAGLEARFNRPSGIAISPAGDLYVADTLNACIRKIHADVVSTFAGSPNRVGHADGPSADASFTYPKALAFDREGVLYVGDETVGLRRITRDGDVSTIPLRKGTAAAPPRWPSITGIAVAQAGPDELLYVADDQGLLRYRVRDGTITVVTNDEAPLAGRFASGTPYALAAYPDGDLVTTDIFTDAVRYVRPAFPPRVTTTFSANIAAPLTENAANTGGAFADGPLETARFSVPMGVALLDDGRIVVADTGNRRIRIITPLDRRRPAADDRAEPGFDASAFNVAYVGDSGAFWNTMWQNSIPGLIEQRLMSDAPRLRIKDPRVRVTRIDTSGLQPILDSAARIAAARGANLVIAAVNSGMMYGELTADRNETFAAAQARLVAALQTTHRTLSAHGVTLLVVLQPLSWESSPLESAWYRQFRMAPIAESSLQNVNQRNILHGTGVPFLDLSPAFDADERSAARKPLFEAFGPRTNRRGNALSADTIVEELERRQPWRDATQR